MFTDKQLDRYADILLWGIKTARTKTFKKNDVVLIRYDMPAVQLAEVVYAKLLDLGIHPVQPRGEGGRQLVESDSMAVVLICHVDLPIEPRREDASAAIG